MACPFVFPALLLSFCLPVCRCYRSLPVNSFHISGELGGHSPPASTFRVCDEKHGCRIMVCFLRRKTLRMALNLLSASWFSLFWNNYVTPTRAAEQTGLNKMMNACKRGGGGWRVMMKMALVLPQKGPQAVWQTCAVGNGFSVILTLTLIVGSNT